MDEGRPPDPAIGPEPAPGEPAPQAVEPVEPIDPVDVEPIQRRPPSRRVIALVVVLIIAFVSFAVVGGRLIVEGPAAASPSTARLAYTDGAGALHTVDSDGTNVTDYPLE